jgi:hypothetical protein
MTITSAMAWQMLLAMLETRAIERYFGQSHEVPIVSRTLVTTARQSK